MAEHLHTFPEGETVVGLTEHKGILFVATNRRVYIACEVDTEFTLVPVRIALDETVRAPKRPERPQQQGRRIGYDDFI